ARPNNPCCNSSSVLPPSLTHRKACARKECALQAISAQNLPEGIRKTRRAPDRLPILFASNSCCEVSQEQARFVLHDQPRNDQNRYPKEALQSPTSQESPRYEAARVPRRP